ncbi:hypothetical protein FVF58_32740 [Paraburkholderia panacisoli]|uniref:Uncharacterized protein n=1 Tax=Paraburkholderia panacisoli TaxID=2603818 RepID=A0A5B0GM93_9BURK|nr:hypothetical protein [Paraburkholderia panacisoli]KAA1004372.1 hypothetical protein FVF58_32740 [Paraburkholderia panacisoli]
MSSVFFVPAPEGPLPASPCNAGFTTFEMKSRIRANPDNAIIRRFRDKAAIRVATMALSFLHSSVQTASASID